MDFSWLNIELATIYTLAFGLPATVPLPKLAGQADQRRRRREEEGGRLGVVLGRLGGGLAAILGPRGVPWSPLGTPWPPGSHLCTSWLPPGLHLAPHWAPLGTSGERSWNLVVVGLAKWVR